MAKLLQALEFLKIFSELYRDLLHRIPVLFPQMKHYSMISKLNQRGQLYSLLLVTMVYTCMCLLGMPIACQRNQSPQKPIKETGVDSLDNMTVGALDELACRSQQLGYYQIEADALEKILTKMQSVPFDGKARIILRLAQAYSRTGHFEECLDRIYEIKTANLNDSLKAVEFEADRLLAHVYHALGYPDRGLEIIAGAEHRAKAIVDKDERDKIISSIYLTRASLYVQKGRMAEALDEINAASKIPRHPNIVEEQEWDIGRNILLSAIYEGLGQTEMARICLENNLESTAGSGSYNRILSGLNYAAFNIRTGELNTALDVTGKLIGQTDSQPMPLFRLEALKLQALALHGLGQETEAFLALEEAFDISDSLMHTNKAGISALEYFESRLKVSASEDAQRKSLRRESITTLIIILCLILVSIIIIILLRLQKRRHEFEELQNEMELDKKQFDSEIQSSRETIDSQNRKLARLSLEMAQIEEGISLIKQELSNKDASDKDSLNAISSLVKTLKFSDNLSEIFHSYFEASHEVFFSNLYRLHPDLTKGEKRMCAFILLNLSNKEIASFLYRSPRSVETAKYRLFKKLGIEGADAYNYLQSLCQENVNQKGNVETKE